MLNTHEKVVFLRDIPTFELISPTQIEIFADLCETPFFSAGNYIFRQGDTGDSLFIVVKGRVAIEREIRDANDSISLTVIKPHQYFGEMSLFYHIPRMVTATAMEDTVLIQIMRDIFISFCRQYPDLLISLNQIMSQRLVEAYDKISELTSNQKPRELREL